MPTTSFNNVSAIENKMVNTIQLSKDTTEAPLVAAIHPDVDRAFKEHLGLHPDANLSNIAGVPRVIVTERVPGFRVIECNEHL